MEVLSSRPDFEQLLQILAGILSQETSNSLGPTERAMLKQSLDLAGLIYSGTRFMIDRLSRSTLYELAEPIARITELLMHPPNVDDLLIALGAPTTLAMSPDQQAVKKAIERYETLLRDLHQIAHAVPPAPSKSKRGAPVKTKDLRALVESIADYWVRATGKAFTQDWQKGEPITGGTRFLVAVVRFIDPNRLKSLPRITAAVVTKRRAEKNSSVTFRK